MDYLQADNISVNIVQYMLMLVRVVELRKFVVGNIVR